MPNRKDIINNSGFMYNAAQEHRSPDNSEEEGLDTQFDELKNTFKQETSKLQESIQMQTALDYPNESRRIKGIRGASVKARRALKSAQGMAPVVLERGKQAGAKAKEAISGTEVERVGKKVGKLGIAQALGGPVGYMMAEMLGEGSKKASPMLRDMKSMFRKSGTSKGLGEESETPIQRETPAPYKGLYEGKGFENEPVSTPQKSDSYKQEGVTVNIGGKETDKISKKQSGQEITVKEKEEPTVLVNETGEKLTKRDVNFADYLSYSIGKEQDKQTGMFKSLFNTLKGQFSMFSMETLPVDSHYRMYMKGTAINPGDSYLAGIYNTLRLMYAHSRFGQEESNSLLLQLSQINKEGLAVDGKIKKPKARTFDIAVRRFIAKTIKAPFKIMSGILGYPMKYFWETLGFEKKEEFRGGIKELFGEDLIDDKVAKKLQMGDTESALKLIQAKSKEGIIKRELRYLKESIKSPDKRGLSKEEDKLKKLYGVETTDYRSLYNSTYIPNKYTTDDILKYQTDLFVAYKDQNLMQQEKLLELTETVKAQDEEHYERQKRWRMMDWMTGIGDVLFKGIGPLVGVAGGIGLMTSRLDESISEIPVIGKYFPKLSTATLIGTLTGAYYGSFFGPMGIGIGGIIGGALFPNITKLLPEIEDVTDGKEDLSIKNLTQKSSKFMMEDVPWKVLSGSIIGAGIGMFMGLGIHGAIGGGVLGGYIAKHGADWIFPDTVGEDSASNVWMMRLGVILPSAWIGAKQGLLFTKNPLGAVAGGIIGAIVGIHGADYLFPDIEGEKSWDVITYITENWGRTLTFSVAGMSMFGPKGALAGAIVGGSWDLVRQVTGEAEERKISKGFQETRMKREEEQEKLQKKYDEGEMGWIRKQYEKIREQLKGSSPYYQPSPTIETEKEEFATGGIVSGRIGEPKRITAHAGELILPTHQEPEYLDRIFGDKEKVELMEKEKEIREEYIKVMQKDIELKKMEYYFGKQGLAYAMGIPEGNGPTGRNKTGISGYSSGLSQSDKNKAKREFLSDKPISGGKFPLESAMAMTKDFEGFIPKAKPDIGGKGGYTVAYGRYGVDPGTSVTREQANRWLKEDYLKHKEFAKSIDGFHNLNSVRKIALVDLAYTMGPGGLNSFKGGRTFNAIKNGNYTQAARYLMKTKWARDVGNRRARKIAGMIATGSEELLRTQADDPTVDKYYRDYVLGDKEYEPVPTSTGSSGVDPKRESDEISDQKIENNRFISKYQGRDKKDTKELTTLLSSLNNNINSFISNVNNVTSSNTTVDGNQGGNGFDADTNEMLRLILEGNV